MLGLDHPMSGYRILEGGGDCGVIVLKRSPLSPDYEGPLFMKGPCL